MYNLPTYNYQKIKYHNNHQRLNNIIHSIKANLINQLINLIKKLYHNQI
jgi:hypothetical protein